MNSTQQTERSAASSRRRSSDHPGPPPGAPLIAFAATFLAGILIGPIAGAGAVPSLFADGRTVAAYFVRHHDVVRSSGWLMMLSSIALLVFSAVTYSRLAFLAPNAPGPVIVGFGGVLASSSLALSGAVTWVLAHDAVTQNSELVRTLHYLNFVSGGPLHTAALGVLVLGLAVTTGFLHRTPRALSVVGVVLAGLDLLSTVSLVFEPATTLIPIGRFASIAWLIVISLRLPRGRAARRSHAVT